MKYYAPYGSSDPEAPYVDRDTPGAVRGSVPPAKSIEMPMREIVDVIKKAGLNPSNDLQLWEAIRQSFVIDTPVVKSVYGPGADFADLNAAHAWASRFRIIGGGSLTLNLAAGKFTSGAQHYFSHVDGRRVTVNGAAFTGGGFPMEANFAITGSSASQRLADNTANIAMLRTRFATELAFTGTGNITFGNVGIVRNLLTTGSGLAVDGIIFTNCEFCDVQNVAAYGFGARNIVTTLAKILFTNVAGVGGNSTGISVEESSAASFFDRMFAFGNAGTGIACIASSSLVTQSGSLAIMVSKGNGLEGILANGKGRIQTSGSNGSKAELNGTSGWKSISNGYIECVAAVSNNNAGFAFSVENDGFIDARNTTGSGNSVGYGAANKSFITAQGGTAGVASPSLNTIGNNLSLIQA